MSPHSEIPKEVYPYIINGQDITTNPYPVTNHQNDLIHHFASISLKDDSIDQLTVNAKEGFHEWSSISINEKIKIFEKVKENILNKRSELFKGHSEIGGPDWFANFNVDGCLGQLQEYISQLSRSPGEIVQSSHSDLAMTFKEPVGPVLSISPWNAPVILAGRSIIAPLAAGCSVIVKSSEKSPKTAYILVKCFLDAGIPSKALQLVHVKPEENPSFIDKVLKTGIIKKVNFTGSTIVGKKIAEVCGKNLIPYLLELGGKNISIVLNDANLKSASGKILFGAWAHKGQICMSTDKVFIDENIYDEFKKQIIETAEGFSKDKDHQICQRDTIGRDKVIDLVEDALNKGANLVFGTFNKEEILNSNIIQPIILENVTSKMDINSIETFGPVFTLHKFKDVQDVVKEINDHDYGLKGSVWSTNIIKALKIARQLEIGGVHINAPTVHDEPTVPHGGVKSSGLGRFNSHWGMDEFQITKTITINE
ncbi:uncharacterized protein KGF55_000574 [Candida pseudojiufengensis]|uniref:uncharacterized protein n=1 Tax=Candida pseudojiufengensis TaxID=497109 RepID=UPI0022258082|nr:uncharacterized protein KGF55_000574 [Candida pseudojiufengensis]KAI5966265.1 hypothetical protein KGF55_000574 [Candida pseudojiufengensis]